MTRYLNGGDTLVQSRKKKLVLLWGQSNAAGEDDYASITNANGYVNNYTPVQLSQYVTHGLSDPPVYDVAGTRAAAAPRAVAGQPNFGPELSLARHLNLVLPDSWCVAKWGMYSTGLQLHWLPTANYPSGDPINLFHKAMNDAAVQAAAQNAVVSALVWIQGEQDALDATQAANYQANLTTFINAVRAVYSDLPVVIAKLCSVQPMTYTGTVRTAQINWVAGDQNAAIVDTDDLTPLITTYHYSANNLVTLGNRCASAVLGLLGIEDTPQSHPWTTDGDGIAFPQNATEWNALLAAAGIASGGPFRISDCTVASGNLPDLLGGPSLVASGTAATYHAAIPGHARTGVSATDGATTKFSSTDASLPDQSSESTLTLTYVRGNSTPGTFRNVTTLGTTVKHKLSLKSGGVIDDFDGGTNNTVGTAHPVGALRPFVVQRDHSTTTARVATDQEMLTTAWATTVAGKGIAIVGEGNGAVNAVTAYEASFRGAAAEMTAAQIKSLLTTAGWTLQY